MKPSAIVIGGGITGISTAENLRREGVDVTLIDINIEGYGTIVIKNDGNGIDVVEHQQHK